MNEMIIGESLNEEEIKQTVENVMADTDLRWSVECEQIMTSLSLMQGEMRDPIKKDEGYKFDYANFSHVLEIARPLFSKYNLVCMQSSTTKDDKIKITTAIFHTSGQYIISAYEVTDKVLQAFSTPKTPGTKASMNELQAQGSCISYIKRYTLQSIIMMSSVDDDGHSYNTEIVKNKENLVSAILSNKISPEDVNTYLNRYKAKNLNSLSLEQIKMILGVIDKREQQEKDAVWQEELAEAKESLLKAVAENKITEEDIQKTCDYFKVKDKDSLNLQHIKAILVKIKKKEETLNKSLEDE